MNSEQTNDSPHQQALNWARNASQTAADQKLKQQQKQTETEPTSDSEKSQRKQPPTRSNSRAKQVYQWGKQASLVAAKEYLSWNNQQLPDRNEHKKLTPMETFLEILNTAAYGLGVLASILLFLLIRFGLGQY